MQNSPLLPLWRALFLPGMFFVLLFGACASGQSSQTAASRPLDASNHDLAMAIYGGDKKGGSSGDSVRRQEESISQVIERANGGVQRCVERSMVVGEVKKTTHLEVSLEITQGKATRVDIAKVKAGSYLASCLKGHFSRLRYPVSSERIALRFPLVVAPVL